MNIVFLIGVGISCFFPSSSNVLAFAPSSVINNFSAYATSKVQQRPSCPTALEANLITFDLDDTIFPVGPVVNDANAALINHLAALGCVTTTQDTFLKSTKLIRTSLSSPITYTELRQRAIRMEMEKHLDISLITDEEVSRAYYLWEDHRHMAAEKHLYHDTISMLSNLKSNHPDVVIAAITNGKGNPLRMKSIQEYFDFCVSGEDDDVFPLRKPHAGIYKIAMKRYGELLQSKGAMNENHAKDVCWIHVGDDLANDVGASAKSGARAIWVDLDDEYNQTASKRDPNAAQPAWSTATKEELEIRKEMNTRAQKYVSARVTKLADLPGAIRSITESVRQ
jgi:FMN phosphatase YigB (HAD superfamily)